MISGKPSDCKREGFKPVWGNEQYRGIVITNFDAISNKGERIVSSGRIYGPNAKRHLIKNKAVSRTITEGSVGILIPNSWALLILLLINNSDGSTYVLKSAPFEGALLKLFIFQFGNYFLVCP